MEKQNVWEEVLAKTDIVNVISEYVPLTKQGKNFRACCPFHGEKTPSFIVSLNKQIFRCFGCGKSGNAIKFLDLHASKEARTSKGGTANKSVDEQIEILDYWL